MTSKLHHDRDVIMLLQIYVQTCSDSFIILSLVGSLFFGQQIYCALWVHFSMAFDYCPHSFIDVLVSNVVMSVNWWININHVSGHSQISDFILIFPSKELRGKKCVPFFVFLIKE